MKTPLALLNLRHEMTRTVVSVAGMGFALLLVFMQLGFKGAVSHTATNIYNSMKFDLVIRGSDYAHLYEPGQLAMNSLRTAAGIKGVHEVIPVWIGLQNWRSLAPKDMEESHKAQFLPVAIMAVRPQDEVFNRPDLTSKQRLLTTDQQLLVDDSTQRDYGPYEGRRFSERDTGRLAEVADQQFTIAGTFKLGTGLAANAAVMTSEKGFDPIAPWDASEIVSLGLIRIDGSTQIDVIQKELQARLGKAGPGDEGFTVEVLTRDEALQKERFRWLWQTPIGLIFNLGVGLSLLVGAAIVYMVLATDVTDRLPEYATLLAIGYTYRYLCALVLTQALVLGMCGFVVSWAVSEALYLLTEFLSGLPIRMTPLRVAGVGFLGIAVCLVSGTLALRKLWKAEPASLF